MSHEASASPIPPGERFDVVGLGLNAMDYITRIPSFPVPGRKTPIHEIRLEPGGQVATALATCARLGLRTRYIGSVGSDELGRIQINSLQKEGIDVSGVRIVDGATTQLALSLIEDGVGERTILWHRDPMLIYPVERVSRDVIRSGRILHLDGRDSEAALQAARWAREDSIPVMIDIDKVYDETTPTLLAHVDDLIAAEEFALELTGCGNPDDAVVALAAGYPQARCGVTLGPNGAVFMIDGRVEHFPAFQVDVRDTTGAGDVFHGAFLVGILEQWDIRQTIRFAHAAAAIKCTALGARTGIPDRNQIEAFLESAVERTV
jgi:sugar/nucleoside kinase (ribokinase family)